MKELSIEEKAKAYDEALERAKTMQEKSNGMILKKWLWGVFPELKESEDEKIRKCICLCLEECVHNDIIRDYEKDKCLTWLEKQCETTDVDPVFSYNNLVTKKQSAKKPIDKVESKFKVGDWVVFKNKHQSIYQVEKIEDGYYILRHTHGGTFRVCVLHDESLRLWTIQDAKPGDVLVNWNNTIYLFKGIDDGEVVKFYCFYNTNYEEFKTPFDDDSHLGLTEPQFEHHPAIKEQRELLFIKMKDAGYEFDFEKKELKKIEQNNTEEYIETKGLSELEAEAEELTKEISDEIEADKVVIKQGEHNSAWSEEDTETLNGIVNYLFTSTDVSSIEGSDKWYDWLKSLKSRIQPKQKWSEEDEKCLKELTQFFENLLDCVATEERHKENRRWLNWLKSLRPQKLHVYNPYKAVVESIAKMCDRYKNCMCDEKEAKDFLANVAVKCREATEYNKKYMEE